MSSGDRTAGKLLGCCVRSYQYGLCQCHNSTMAVCFRRGVIVLMCFGLLPDVHNQQCDDVSIVPSTNLDTARGEHMAYVGRHEEIHVECHFSCLAGCQKEKLLYRKDKDPVYEKIWGGEARPRLGYEDKVNHDLVVDDDASNSYILQWKETKWEDLPAGQAYTTWSCEIKTDTCFSKTAETNVYYYMFPALELYANSELVQSFRDVELITSGEINCTVFSYPRSELTLKHGQYVISKDYSCVREHQYEFQCSIVAQDFDFSGGFECEVAYKSPETERVEKVVPDGCCGRGLYPVSSASGLSTGEIVLIVVGVGVLVAVAIILGLAWWRRKTKKEPETSRWWFF